MRIFYFLLAVAPLFAASAQLQVSTETVPAGSLAQVKVFLTSPQAISFGQIQFDVPATVEGVTIFSSNGDAVGYASRNYSDLVVSFVSDSGGIGRVPGVPLLQFSVRADAALTIHVNAEKSRLTVSGKPIEFTAGEGRVIIGGSLSVSKITPDAEKLVIEGTGFTDRTSVQVDGLPAASTAVISSTHLEATLPFPIDPTGKRIRLSSPDGASTELWGGPNTGFYTLPSTPMWKATCAWNGPAYHDPIQLVLYNPNKVPAQVTITNAFDEQSSRIGTITKTIAAGQTRSTPIGDPPNSTFETDPATPLRAQTYLLYSYSYEFMSLIPCTPETRMPVIGSIANAASLQSGAFAPEEIITIFGTDMGTESTLLIDGSPAKILYYSATQVNAQIPAEAMGRTNLTLQIETSEGLLSNRVIVPIAATHPGLLTLASTGVGPAVSSEVATRGSAVHLYATGTTADAPLWVRIGGIGVPVDSARYNAGILQFGFTIPQSLPLGDTSVVLIAGDNESQPGVTLAIR